MEMVVFICQQHEKEIKAKYFMVGNLNVIQIIIYFQVFVINRQFKKYLTTGDKNILKE